jgi:single-stranded DNA-binding protein
MQQTTINTFGNVTKNAQTRTGKNNRPYAAFTVAINPKPGETEFLKCFAWGRQSEFAKNLTKGVRVQISGTRTERKANNGGQIIYVRTKFVRTFPAKAASAA